MSCEPERETPARKAHATADHYTTHNYKYQEPSNMKKIEAIVRHFKLEDVKNALIEKATAGLTVPEARGFGRQKGHTEMYRGTEYRVDFVPKVKLELVVEESKVQIAIAAIVKVSQTGQVGDGKIFVSTIDEAVRIRTGESGGAAL